LLEILEMSIAQPAINISSEDENLGKVKSIYHTAIHTLSRYAEHDER